MGFNYGLEKRKFTEEWKKLYSEYKAAGMSEEDIQDIYAFDLNVFRKNRTECQRTQPLSESSCDDGIEQGESMSALLKKFSSALSVCDKYSFQSDPRFAWVDEMENDECRKCQGAAVLQSGGTNKTPRKHQAGLQKYPKEQRQSNGGCG